MTAAVKLRPAPSIKRKPPQQYKTFSIETIAELIAKGTSSHRMQKKAVRAAELCREFGYTDDYRITGSVIAYAETVYDLLKKNGDISEISITKLDFVWLCNQLDRFEARRRYSCKRNKRMCGLATPDSPAPASYLQVLSKGTGARHDEVLTNPKTGNSFMYGFDYILKDH